jgi:sugar phosphate isomerase/epimerase
MSCKIAFNTANLVGQFTGWSYVLGEWGEQDKLTVDQFDDTTFAEMCMRVRDAGFAAVELWRAHVDPTNVTPTRAEVLRGMLTEAGLEPVALAGPLTDETARVCRLLGIDRCCGNLAGQTPADVADLARSTGVAFDYENHPETSAAQILQSVPDGCGVALDLGWLGTQGLDAPSIVRELGSLIRHVHVKDVKAAGGHETVPLGTGVVDIDNTFVALNAIGYDGWYSWEDEPEDRNPYDIAAEMRQWIEERLAA